MRTIKILISHWFGILKGVVKGVRNQSAAELISYRMAKINVFDNQALAVELTFIRAWNNMNTPPMNDDELNRTFKSIVRREQNKRVNAEDNQPRP